MIWVIDDDAATSDVLSAMLKQLGYETRAFTAARDALAAYKPGSAEIVISDVRMPDLDGLEFTRALKKKDPRVIIVVLTGFPSVEDAVEAIRLGAADYMTKPLSLEEMRLRLLRVLEARDLQDRFHRNRMLTWLLIGSLPVWFLLGIALALIVAKC